MFFFFNDPATTEIYSLFPTRRSSDLPAPHVRGVAHRQPALGVGLDEIDGEPLRVVEPAIDGKNGAAMRPGIVTTTVDDEPALALERRPQDWRRPRGHLERGQAVADRRWRLGGGADRRERIESVVEKPRNGFCRREGER